MGPVSYLYLAGGISMVILGFYLLGILQHLAFSLLSPGPSSSGTIPYLLILYPLVAPDSSFNGTIVYIVRYFLLGIVLIRLISKASPIRHTKPQF